MWSADAIAAPSLVPKSGLSNTNDTRCDDTGNPRRLAWASVHFIVMVGSPPSGATVIGPETSPISSVGSHTCATALRSPARSVVAVPRSSTTGFLHCNSMRKG